MYDKMYTTKQDAKLGWFGRFMSSDYAVNLGLPWVVLAGTPIVAAAAFCQYWQMR